jgi:hypothetical protein
MRITNLRKYSKKILKLLTIGIIATFILINKTEQAFALETDFAWAGKTYGRGVGTIPGLQCHEGLENISGLCFKKCRDGYSSSSITPQLFCIGHTYQTTVKPQQTWYSHSGSSHHRKRHSHFGCPPHGDPNSLDYSKRPYALEAGLCVVPCRPGYRRSGSQCKNHGDYGRGVGQAQVERCAAGETLSAGLCYKQCREGYTGAGPVCLSLPPKGYELCGVGYNKGNLEKCGTRLSSQASAVSNLALSSGTSSIIFNSYLPLWTQLASSNAMKVFLKGALSDLKIEMESTKATFEHLSKNPLAIAEGSSTFISALGKDHQKKNALAQGIDTFFNAIPPEIWKEICAVAGSPNFVSQKGEERDLAILRISAFLAMGELYRISPSSNASEIAALNVILQFAFPTLK